jgi:2-methylcitrate dehydratase
LTVSIFMGDHPATIQAPDATYHHSTIPKQFPENAIMDKTTTTLANYIGGLTYDQLTPGAIGAIKNRLIDAIACGIGGYSSEPAGIARRLAAEVSGKPSARILGSGASTSMEMAAFANAVMVRYLDCNDTYIAKGSGHPSDMIPACLAVAEAHHASGKDTMTAVAAAYEVFTGLANVVGLRERGWDQGVFVVLGAAAGAAKLLGLTSAQIAEALSIAISSSIPTRQARAGELAMWKGCATAAAARAGVFSALLAQKGMTGPTAPIEGKHGMWEQVTGPFQIGKLGGAEVPFGIERSNLKFFPAEYHSQAPLWVAIELRKKVRPEDIASIDIQTYYMAWSEIGSEPEKWDPQTRETADHSLPYLFALGLVDGAIRADSFNEERLRDPRLRQLMPKITISENKDYTRDFPAKLTSRFEVKTRDGKTLVETTSYPKGHAKNPMNDADVESKFAGLTEGLLKPGQREALLRALRDIDKAADVGSVLELVRVES